MTVEIRAWIKNIEVTLKKLEELECTLKGTYSFRDYIYDLKDKSYNFNKEFIRVRSYEKTNWNQKSVQLVHKLKSKPNFSADIIFSQGFDNLAEAESFLKSSHTLAFSAFRKGTEFSLNKLRIFVEDIEFLNPSIEVLGSTKEEVSDFFHKIEHIGFIKDSVAQLIYSKSKYNKKCSLLRNTKSSILK